MKKSTYIDFAVIMAARSHKSKKRNKPARRLLSMTVPKTKHSENRQISKALTAAMVLEVFTHGLTA